MKKFLTFFFALLLLVFPSSVSAEEFKTKSIMSGDIVTIEKDEVIEGDYFAVGDTVSVFGTINGDLYVAAGQIIIDGTVNGDLLAAGGDLRISGNISQDARLFGGQISIDGTVGRNATLVGGTVELGNSAEIVGSLVTAGGNIILNAPIGGNLIVGAGNLTVSNTIGGYVEAGVEVLTLTPSAQISGDLDYWSEDEASITQGATVSGKITRKDPKTQFDSKELQAAQGELDKFSKGLSGTSRIIGFLSYVLVGLLLLHFYPKFSVNVIETLKKRPWPSLGLGAVALFLTPIALIFVAITIIGIPVALITFAGYLVYAYLAKLFVILWAGMFLAEKVNKKLSLNWTFILGLIAYSVITMIPVVGGFTRFFTLLFGLGAMLLTCKETYSEAKSKNLI